jgi:hypothetical protein
LSVFVLDKPRRSVMPCCEKRARRLLERGRVVVHRRYPFTIRMPTGKKGGNHVGRAAVRGSGSLRAGNADASNATYCKLRHRADGYCCARQPALPPRPEEQGFQRERL